MNSLQRFLTTNLKSSVFLLVCLCPTLAGAEIFPTPPAPDPPAGLDPRIEYDDSQSGMPSFLAGLEWVASREGIPREELVVLSSRPVVYPGLQLTGQSLKIADRRADGGSFEVFIPDQGEPLDPRDRIAEERQLLSERNVKFDQTSFERWLSEGGEPRWVTFWLDEPPYEPPPRPMPDEQVSDAVIEDFIHIVDERRSAHVAPVIDQFLDRTRQWVEHDLHFDPERAGETTDWGISYDRFSPVVHVRIPADVFEQIVALESVQTAYLSFAAEFVPHLDVSRDTIGAGYVESFFNNTGKGVKVALIEEGPVSPRAVRDGLLPPVAGPQRTSLVSEHATVIAGIVASQDATQRGVAADVQLWNSGRQFSQLNLDFTELGIAADLEAAASWGANVVNCSFGQSGPSYSYAPLVSRKADELVGNLYRTVVASAGNEGTAVKAPADGYNVIAVGGYLQNDTRHWSDDKIFALTNGINPTSKHGDRQKPEVSAPAGRLHSVNLSSAIELTRVPAMTSGAAAHVSGAAAVLMEANPSLKVWPEALRAIFLATAFHNVEGPSLSGRDGVGGIDTFRARRVATNSSAHGGWGGLRYDASQPANRELGRIFVKKGVRVRVAISWINIPWVYFWDKHLPEDWAEPSMDLDLKVEGVTDRGTLTETYCKRPIFGDSRCWYVYSNDSYSASFDRNFEIVEFRPTEDGWYRILVSRDHKLFGNRFGGPARYLAWAWHQDYW